MSDNGARDGRGWSRGGLREDPRSWLIRGEPQIVAVIRALEVAALGMAGRILSKHVTPAVRAMGVFMVRLADGRIRTMREAGGAQEVAIDMMSRVMMGLAGKRPMDEEALDEIYAVVFQADSHAQSVGIVGPGTLRSALRGD